MQNRTLALVKSHAVPYAEQILKRIMVQERDLTVVRCERKTLTAAQAGALYVEHAGRPYYDNLLGSVGYGVVAIVLSGDDAVARWRALMGATDPAKAAPGTIRSSYGNHSPGLMHANAVHGSDSPESAEREIAIVFPELA